MLRTILHQNTYNVYLVIISFNVGNIYKCTMTNSCFIIVYGYLSVNQII